MGSETEKILQQKLSSYLKKWFHVEIEVYSTDMKSRIDLVIVHFHDINIEYPIGIEIKIDSKKRGKDLANWIKQSSEYSKKEFKGYGKCMIVTCPQVSGDYLREGHLMTNHEIHGDYGQANNIGTFISQFNIGEFQKYILNGVTKYRIVYKGQKIWDCRDGELRINNYTRQCKK